MNKLLRKRSVVLALVAFLVIAAPPWLFVAIESVAMMRIWYALSIVALLAVLVSLLLPMRRLTTLTGHSRRYRQEHPPEGS